MERARGFTLLELLITVTIIGILAAIAYPSYTGYLVKGTRANAKSVLLDIAQKEQAYLLDNRSYVGAVGCDAVRDTLNLASDAMVEVAKYYDCTVTAPAGNPPTFTATLSPKPGGRMAGDGNLTIDQTGRKTGNF